MGKTGMEKNTVEKKRREEQATVRLMIEIYCSGKHGTKRGELCPECKELADYVAGRTEHCPHMAEKTSCAACKTHCYKPAMREKIRAVMRYSGPRVIFYSPRAAFRHLFLTVKSKING